MVDVYLEVIFHNVIYVLYLSVSLWVIEGEEFDADFVALTEPFQ